MEVLFTWCAVIGGSIFAVQFISLLMGLDGGNDVDFDSPDLDVPDVDVPDMDVPDLDVDADLDVGEMEGLEDQASLKDADVDFDRPDRLVTSDGWFVGIITFRSLVAAVTVFGLVGLGAVQHLPPSKAFIMACLAGVGMLYLVGWSFKKIYALRADGTVRMRDTIGQTGTVYIPIPGENSGAGKVTVAVKGRTMEYRATTPGEPLTTGVPIQVTKVISEDTLQVQSITSEAHSVAS